MGCTFPVLFVKWVSLLTLHHFEAQSPLGTGDGAPGMSGPRTVPSMGLLTPLPTSVVPQDLAMYINEVKRDKETLKKISEFQSSIENLVS